MMKRAASALLPPSRWPSSCSSATIRSPSIGRAAASGRGRRPRTRPRARRPPGGRSRPRGPSPRASPGTPARRRVGRRPAARHRQRPPDRRRGRGHRLDRRRRRATSGQPAAPRLLPAPRAHSASRMLIAISSQKRPSRKIASRARPSTTKPTLLVGADRPLVEREDGQAHPVQAQPLERVLEHELGRLGAVAAAPEVLLADRDVEERRAVVAVELAEGARADEPVRVAQVDGQRRASRAEDARREEALDLVGPHRAVLVAGQAGDLGVAVPAPERGQVLRDVAAQDDRSPDERLRETSCGGMGDDGIPSAPCAAGARSPSGSARPRGPPRRPASWPTSSGRCPPTSCRSPPSSGPAGRSPRPTDGPPASAGRRSRPRSPRVAGVSREALGEAYDRHSDLGKAVADVLGRGRPEPGRRPPPTRRRSPRSPRRSPRSRPPSGPAAKARPLRGAPPALRPADRQVRRQDPRRRAPDRTARGAPRGGPRRGVRAPARRRQAGRPADRRRRRDRPARPRRPPGRGRAAPLPPAQVHARVAGRGRRRDHRPGSGPTVWVEDKYDGIRAQLHRRGRRSASTAATSTRSSDEFPEVSPARATSPGTGSSTASCWPTGDGAGRCRSSPSRAARPEAPSAAILAEVPVIFVAFDVARARAAGPAAPEALLERPLAERRRAPRGARPARSPPTAARSPCPISCRSARSTGSRRSSRRPGPAQRGPDGQGPDERATRPAGAASAG